MTVVCDLTYWIAYDFWIGLWIGLATGFAFWVQYRWTKFKRGHNIP